MTIAGQPTILNVRVIIFMATRRNESQTIYQNNWNKRKLEPQNNLNSSWKWEAHLPTAFSLKPFCKNNVPYSVLVLNFINKKAEYRHPLNFAVNVDNKATTKFKTAKFVSELLLYFFNYFISKWKYSSFACRITGTGGNCSPTFDNTKSN